MSSGFVGGRYLFVALCGLLLTISVGACGDDDAASSPTSSLAPDTTVAGDADDEIDLGGVTLRIGLVATTSGFRKAVYDESGAFDGVPYNIEWSEFDSANSTVEALNAGALDMTVSHQPTVAVLAQGNASTPWTAESAPYVVVGAEEDIDDPGFQVLVRPDSGIESVEDLVGKRVVYSRGAAGHYFFVRLAREAGFGPDEYEEVFLPAGEGRAAFASGAVDAVVSGYRTSLPLISSGDAVSIASSGDTIKTYSVSMARAGLIDDPAHAAAVADVLRRLQDSQDWQAENLDAVASIHETIGNLDPEDARVAAVVDGKRRVLLDDEVIAALQDQADVFFAEGVIANEIDVRMLLDPRFNDDVPERP